MKRTILAVSLLAVCFFSKAYGQFGGCLSVERMSTELKATTTVVAITGNEKFDANLKAGMDKFWELTEYEFLPIADVKKLISDKTKSIIMPLQISITDNVSTQIYPLLGFFIGGQANMSKYGYEQLVAYAPIDNFANESTVEKSYFRASHFPQFFQKYVEIVVSGELDLACERKRWGAEQIYNKNQNNMKGKTMLIEKSLLKNVSEKDVAKYFTTKYEIVTKEKLEQDILEGRENACYLMPVFTRHKLIFVVDCENGDILFNTYDTYGIGLKKADLKQFGAAAAAAENS